MKTTRGFGLLALSLVLGCQAGATGVGAGGATAASTTAAESTSGDAVVGSTGSQFMSGTGVGGQAPMCTPGGPDDDVDQDGFTPTEGDCDDCDPNRNPNAIEVPTPEGKEAFDEDCDMQVDEDDTVLCDDGLLIDAADPMDGVHAIDLCKASTGPKDWGVVSAAWVLADGSAPPSDPATRQKYDLGHGMLGSFGANVTVRKGKRMLALSSGTARNPGDPGYQNPGQSDKGFTSGQPEGFPKESPACPGTVTGQPHDAAAIQLIVLTPSNAKGISFDFDFFTYEWPGFVCSPYNDFFVALLSPKPPGQADENISFDSQGNPVSVNNAPLEVCGCAGNPPNPCLAGTKTFNCPLGDIELIGTGFGFDTAGSDHGSTSWLRTVAPIQGGEPIQLRFAVYDSGDGILATTTLVDNFQWIATPGTKVGTNPVPK
ncbi:MAG: choice-of-anchor L domain-containing protein [Polyangiaceae bacterium]